MRLADPRYDGELSLVAAQVIDDVCVDFERAWRSNAAPAIEDLLGGADGIERSALLRELLAIELEVRSQNGPALLESDFLSRFPQDEDCVRLAFLEMRAADVSDARRQDTVTQAPDGQERLADGSTTRGREAAASTTRAMPWTPGDIIAGDYQLLAEIGAGGMGAVYKARHLHLGKVVALKLLSAEMQTDAAAVARFRREQQAAGRLDHPHIVTATDARQADGCMILAMEYLDGVDLGKLVKSRGPLPMADACELIRQAALGLQHAHEAGLVHRDVKPSNLMLTRGGTVKVLDLGLARLHGESAGAEHATEVGQVMGTYDYMAPEQWDDVRGVDIRADIYGLGCTLFHLLVGHPPFSGPQHQSLVRKLKAHLEEPPPDLTKERPDAPPGLVAALGKALAKNRDERFAEPAEFAGALAPFSAGQRVAELLPQTDAENAAVSASTAAARRQEYEQPTMANTQSAGASRWSKIMSSYRKQIAIVATGAAVLGLALVAFLPEWGSEDDNKVALQVPDAASPATESVVESHKAGAKSPQPDHEMPAIPGPISNAPADVPGPRTLKSDSDPPPDMAPDAPADPTDVKHKHPPFKLNVPGANTTAQSRAATPLVSRLEGVASFAVVRGDESYKFRESSGDEREEAKAFFAFTAQASRIEAELNQPGYCRLIAFQPVAVNESAQFAEIKLTSTDAAEPPAKHFRSSEESWRPDVPGQYALAFLTSPEPLPEMSTWSDLLTEAPWNGVPVGETLSLSPSDDAKAGSEELQKLFDYLKGRIGKASLQLLTFPVREPPG